MPIVINRSTGDVKSPKLTQEQSQKAWEIIVREYVKKHPEILKEVKK